MNHFIHDKPMDLPGPSPLPGRRNGPRGGEPRSGGKSHVWMGRSWEDHGKTMGKPWENGDLYGKSPCLMGKHIVIVENVQEIACISNITT